MSMVSMSQLREALSLGTELKLMQAENDIKSKVIDEAIILAQNPEMQAIAAKIHAYKLNGVDSHSIAELITAEATQTSIKSVMSSMQTASILTNPTSK